LLRDLARAKSQSDPLHDLALTIALGFRTREIAQQLSLSHKTIEKHRSNLMRKLGLRSATAVAAYAIANDYLRL
jgi:two-component system response regulator NreC